MYKVLLFLGAVLFLACDGKFLSPKGLKHRQLLRQNAPPQQPPAGDGPKPPPQGGTEGPPPENGTAASEQGAPNGTPPPPQAGEAPEEGGNVTAQPPEEGGNGTAQPPVNEGGPAPGGGEIQPSPSAPVNESTEGGGAIEDDAGEPEQVEPNWNGKGKPPCLRCISTILHTGEEYLSCAHNSSKCPRELAKDTSHLKFEKFEPEDIEYQMIAFQKDPSFKLYALTYKEDEIPESLIQPAQVLNPSVSACANCTRGYLSDKDKEPWTNVLTCSFKPLDQCPVRFSEGTFSFEYDVLAVKRVYDSHCLCMYGDPNDPSLRQDLLCVCDYETFKH